MKKGCGKRGCLFGCIGTFLGVILILGFTSYWMVKKEPYVPPKAMLFPDTDLYLKAEVLEDDDLMVDFLLKMMQQANEKQLEELGEGLQRLLAGDLASKKSRKDIKKILPFRVEMSGDLAEEDLVLATGFSLYNNMAKMGFWFLKRSARKDPDSVFGEVAGKAYFKTNADDLFFVALEDNVFYLSRQEESMRRVLDPQTTPGEVEEIHPTLTKVNQSAAAWGMVRGASLGKLLEDVELEGLQYQPSSVGIRLGEGLLKALVFDMQIEDRTSLMAKFYCDVSGADSQTEAALNQLFDDWLTKMEIAVQKTVKPEAGGYLVTLIIGDTASEAVDEE